ncbi:Uncharacterised protein [Mycobacteroides abscessus]|uniref:hypothetical protein n=1 Tax=Mycobacteroides abscessus TaxID=36809 RepID=UPI0004B0CAEF|nr:hypothetical protein [Mycobacteroides abscessus]CPW25934.1 Uncharacterised protein [Mycobacteroides abscessus]
MKRELVTVGLQDQSSAALGLCLTAGGAPPIRAGNLESTVLVCLSISLDMLADKDVTSRTELLAILPVIEAASMLLSALRAND